MTNVNPQRWDAVKQILYRALQLESDRRATFLGEACAGDPDLLEEVESLLRHDSAANELQFLASLTAGYSADAGVNLLFGILAMQNAFVTREDLIHVMTEWVEDKSNAIADMMVQCKLLLEDERALLQALVDKQLSNNDFDPRRSLAKLSSIGALRDEFQQLGDDDIQQTLGFVATGTNASRTAASTVEVELGSSTTSGSRFRIIRPHAKGGLGKVSLARDEELDRDVAVKEVRTDIPNSDEVRSRFVQEAEITGKLQHPGIVPVYGLGTYQDGRPFYAMRFIQGESLNEAIEAFHDQQYEDWQTGKGNLELRQLLGRFIDVCDAIDYAHSRGVLHRDLKPGNIMLGKYGETLVVDWGLAKPIGHATTEPAVADSPMQESSLQFDVGSGPPPTLMGAALGTLAYMSPEQAAGRWDELGPASDVYSLGATLFCLLTGRPPQHDKENALNNIQQGRFPQPREILPRIPVQLESVCLKAMALSAADRYETAGEVKNELVAWLANERVSAAEESWREKLARETRNNPVFQLLPIYILAILAIDLACLDYEGYLSGLPVYARWILRGAYVLSFGVSAWYSRVFGANSFSLERWSRIRMQGRMRYVLKRSSLIVFLLLFLFFGDVPSSLVALPITAFSGAWIALIIATAQWELNEAHFVGKGQQAIRDAGNHVHKRMMVIFAVGIVAILLVLGFLMSLP